MRFARELELDRADHRLPGRADPRDAAGRLDPARPAARSTRRSAPPSPARSWSGHGRTGSIRTSTTSSGSSSAATTRAPTNTRRSWARSRRWRTTCSPRSEHPVTKVMCAGEPPLPTEVAPLARAPLRRTRGRHRQPPALPRVRGAGRLEGSGRSAGSPGGSGPARGRRSRSATSGTTSRCWPRWATARRCRRHPIAVLAVARYIAPPLAEEGVARMIEALVLALPAHAHRGSSRRPSGEEPRWRRGRTSARRGDRHGVAARGLAVA